MRRVPAILIVIFLACPLLCLALFSFSLSTWALDRHFYLELLQDSRLYQVPDTISSASWGSSDIEGTGGLQWRSAWRAARVLLTPEYLREQARRVVNQAFDYLEDTRSPFEPSIDVAPLKADLRGEKGRTFARLLAEDLPVGGTVADLRIGPGHLPTSRPSSISVSQAAAIIQAGIPGFLGSVPDTIRLGDEPTLHFDRGTWERPRFPVLPGLLFTSFAFLLIGAGFLFAAAFLGGATARERLQWLGWPLLVPSAGALLAGVLIMAGVSGSWIQRAVIGIHVGVYGFSPQFIAAVISLLQHIAARAGVALLATGGIGAGISLGLLAWSWAMPRESADPDAVGPENTLPGT